METKTCSKCQEVKLLGSFSPDRRATDGKQSHCRTCKREYQRVYRREHPDMISTSLRAYRATERGKEIHRQQSNRYRARYPRKITAGVRIKTLIHNGTLPHPTTVKCVDCDDFAYDYHHPDYSRPFDVIPLCRACHVARHIN